MDVAEIRQVRRAPGIGLSTTLIDLTAKQSPAARSRNHHFRARAHLTKIGKLSARPKLWRLSVESRANATRPVGAPLVVRRAIQADRPVGLHRRFGMLTRRLADFGHLS